MALRGVDISSYQSSLILNNIDYDFVMIKATQGVNYVNPYCDTHYQQAKAAGKKLAVYHYADGNNAISEADCFVNHTAGYAHEAMFVLDWEGEGTQYTDWALKFMKRVEDRIGYKPAIYMSEYIINKYDWSAVVANSNGLIAAKYSDYEIDNNYDMSGAGQPPTVKWWPWYIMWQWTSKGHLNGYAGDLDCDIAYLTGDQWDRYAGVAAPTPQPEPTTTTTTLAPSTETTTQAPVTTTTTLVSDPIEGPGQPPVPDSTTTTTTTLQPLESTSWWTVIWSVLIGFIKILQGGK